MSAPASWTSPGPLADLLLELGALLATYREHPEGQRYADERLRAFAQAHFRGQPWVRELGRGPPTSSYSASGRSGGATNLSAAPAS